MTKEKHKEVHKKLHSNLDELIADYINHTNALLSKTTLMDFLAWSHEQTINPAHRGGR